MMRSLGTGLVLALSVLSVSPATALAPEEQAGRIAALLARRGLGAVGYAITPGVGADPKGIAAATGPAGPATGKRADAVGLALAQRTDPIPAGFQAPAGLAVCRAAVIEDSPLWTLITLKFTGDPALESRPWSASRRLTLTVKDALLPAYNQAFRSKGTLVTDVGLEQLTSREVRLMMKVSAGTDVTVYKRKVADTGLTEYAVLFEVPVDPASGTGPMSWPVRGRLSSKFGWRLHPILHEHRMHSGIDIAVPEGTPIHAAQSGRVVYSAPKGGAGLCVIIEHGNGRRSSYAHCSKLKVKSGQAVKKDQVLALAGSTGLSTGPHVHFSLTENGKPLDPMHFLSGSDKPDPAAKRGKKSSSRARKKKPDRSDDDEQEHDHGDHDH